MNRLPNKKPILTLDTTIVKDDLPLEVVSKLFIGSIHCAFNSDCLHTKNITHILNASRLPITFPKLFTYLSVDIRDRDSANILSCIPTTNIFIEAGITSGGVLVHCFGGKSRSPAFVCAFLMSNYTWSYDKTFMLLQAVRPSVEINIGFERQLRAYRLANYDVYTAQQLLLRSRIRDLYLLRNEQQQQQQEEVVVMSTSINNNNYSMEKYSEESSRIITQSNPGIARNKRSFLDAKTCIDGKSLDDFEMDTTTTTAATAMNEDEMLLESINYHNNKLPNEYDNQNSLRTSTIPMSYTPPTPTLDVRDLSVITTSNSNRHSSPDFLPTYSSIDKTSTSNSYYQGGNLKSHRNSNSSNNSNSATSSGSSSSNSNNRYTSTSNKKSKSFTATNEVEIQTPTCRLSRPSTNTCVRVIPPLRGLEREFKCSWCNATLFSLANVLRTDIDITHLLDITHVKTTHRSRVVNDANDDDDANDYKAQAKDDDYHYSNRLYNTTNNQTITSSSSNHSRHHSVNNDFKFNAKEMKTNDEEDETQLPLHCTESQGLATSVKKSSFDFLSNYGNNDTTTTYDSTSSQHKQHSGSYSLLLPTVHSQSLQQSPQLQHNDPHYMDESPRITIPPHRMIEDVHVNYRARSAEKQRWLARMSLLHDTDGCKVAKMAEEDENAGQFAFVGQEKYFHIEYMDWMGKDVFAAKKELGDIICFGCSKILGKWSWKPSARLTLNGKLEAPLFMIHKHVVHQMDLPFDATPSNTPRPDEFAINMNY